MNFDEIIRMAINLDELFVEKYEQYCSEDYKNDNYEQFSYEEVDINYEEFCKYIREYYLQKYGKEVMFSFVKINKALGNSLFIESIPVFLPCVISKDCYDGKFYTILIDKCVKTNENYMYYYNKAQAMIPSYIKLIDEEEFKKIFKINGYEDVKLGLAISGDAVVKAKRLVVNTTGRVLN